MESCLQINDMIMVKSLSTGFIVRSICVLWFWSVWILTLSSAVVCQAQVPAEARLKTFLETNTQPQNRWLQGYGPESKTRVIMMTPQITAYLETFRFLYFNLETFKAQGFNQLVFEYFPTSMDILFTTLKEAAEARRLQFVRDQMGTLYYNLGRFLSPATPLTEEHQNVHAKALLTIIERAKALRMFVRFINTDASVDPCLGLIQTRIRDDYHRSRKARHEFGIFMREFDLTKRAIVIGHPNNLARRGALANNLAGQLNTTFPGQVFTVDIQVLRTRAELNSEIVQIYERTSASASGRNFVEFTKVDGYHNATLFLPESKASPLRVQTGP